MKNKKVKVKLTRDEVLEILDAYNIMDQICTDFREMFDTDLGKVRKLESMSTKLKDMFDFRPITDSEGDPNHWRSYVMPDDDRAWYHTPKKDK
tara:strand:+ start:343 stop:621 length:279 start_codon:yes stop_codon:yes gene_type:complete